MKIGIVGGCGHVGLPLGISLAESGAEVHAIDVDRSAIARVNAGDMPFRESGAELSLKRVLAEGRFRATAEPAALEQLDVAIIVIGTPVDDHLNPDPNAVVVAIEGCLPHLRDGQLLMLRSTVFPGVTGRVREVVARAGLRVGVVCCPERILEGQAMRELRTLPQIIGASTASDADRAREVFDLLGTSTVVLTPEEAEFAKLFTNAWRYIKFAAANQFWLMANESGLDFARIRSAIMQDYPRAADLPGAGFAAGPCLLKDTMQLAASSKNSFALGHAAMQVNEGQPRYLVDRIAERHVLASASVGILGMAFKAGSDDTRSSLSYLLKRLLSFRAREVLTTDPYVTTDPDLVPLDEVLARADLLIIGAPHPEYADISTPKPVYDVWDLLGRGTLV